MNEDVLIVVEPESIAEAALDEPEPQAEFTPDEPQPEPDAEEALDEVVVEAGFSMPKTQNSKTQYSNHVAHAH